MSLQHIKKWWKLGLCKGLPLPWKWWVCAAFGFVDFVLVFNYYFCLVWWVFGGDGCFLSFFEFQKGGFDAQSKEWQTEAQGEGSQQLPADSYGESRSTL